MVSASLPPQFGILSLLPFVIPLQRTLSVAFLRLTTSIRPSAPPSGSPKCLGFGHWLTLCTIYLLTYLLTAHWSNWTNCCLVWQMTVFIVSAEMTESVNWMSVTKILHVTITSLFIVCSPCAFWYASVKHNEHKTWNCLNLITVSLHHLWYYHLTEVSYYYLQEKQQTHQMIK